MVDVLPVTLVKVTVPVATGPEAPVTVATKAACEAELEPVGEAVASAVVVGMVVSRKLINGEVLGKSFASPL